MTDSSFTDLLINQPVLVWSLAGGIAILVIAGFLALFLSVRKKAQQKQSTQSTKQSRQQSDVGEMAAVLSEIKQAAEVKTPAQTKKGSKQTAVAAPTDTSPPETADSDSFLLMGAEDTAAIENAVLDIDPIEGEEASAEGEPTAEEKNELAALFQDDAVVDPHIQAMRDNLPAITIDELLTHVRAVAKEMQEKINAEHVNQA